MSYDGLVDAIGKLSVHESDDEEAINKVLSAAERLKLEAQQAQQARLFRKGVNDITQEFTKAAKQLGPGELVKDDFFTLFEAVGALEIMDPKMDSGYVPFGDTFEPVYDILEILDPNETIYIMDELVALEMTWIEGYPLSQTVYTSLHIDYLLNPETADENSFSKGEPLLHIVLRSYCEAVIKCIELTLQLVQSQHFYEEEDFVTHLFGRELLPKITVDSAVDFLHKAVYTIQSQLDVEQDAKEAIELRLQHRLQLLNALAGDWSAWESAMIETPFIEQTHDLAHAIPWAFSQKVQRTLATSTPPRPMKALDFLPASQKWKSICEEILAADNLTMRRVVASPHALQRATWAYSYRGHTTALGRAYIQNRLFDENSGHNELIYYDYLLKDIRELVLAGDALVDPQSFQVEVTSDPRHKCSRAIEGFMNKAMDEYLNLYRMVCQNRCRIRRTFTQAIGVLDELETVAVKADRDLVKWSPSLTAKDKDGWKVSEMLPLSSWVKFHKLRIMSWTVQLGFETEIYLPDEIGSMYWFLSLICADRCTLLRHIDRFTTERSKELTSHEAAMECAAQYQYIKSLHTHAEATRLIAQALWRFCNLLAQVKVITTPKRPFADPKLLYEARLKPFLCVTNDPIPSFDDFEAARRHVGPVDKMCALIDADIKAAKLQLAELKKVTPEEGKYVGTEKEWQKDIKATETVCVAIAVNSSQVLRAWQKDGEEGLLKSLTFVFDRRWHEWWAVPVVKVKEGSVVSE